MALKENEIVEYLKENKSIVLATLGEDNQPDLRALGGYNFDHFDLYFGTSAKSNKVKQLEINNNVTILAQRENQTIPDFKNVTIYGEAVKLTGDDYIIGRQKIQERRPSAEFEEGIKNIYKVRAKIIKVLDFSKEPENQLTNIYLG